MIKYRNSYRKGKVKRRIPTIEAVTKPVSLKEFAKTLSKRTGIPEAEVIVLVEEIGEELINQIKDGKEVDLGLPGSFSVELKRDENLKVTACGMAFRQSAKVKKELALAEVKEV